MKCFQPIKLVGLEWTFWRFSVIVGSSDNEFNEFFFGLFWNVWTSHSEGYR